MIVVVLSLTVAGSYFVNKLCTQHVQYKSQLLASSLNKVMLCKYYFKRSKKQLL